MKAKLLALALGWKEEQIGNSNPSGTSVEIKCEDGKVRPLAVHDSYTMWQIAERLNRFPSRSILREGWLVPLRHGVYGKTPHEAIYNSIIQDSPVMP